MLCISFFIYEPDATRRRQEHCMIALECSTGFSDANLKGYLIIKEYSLFILYYLHVMHRDQLVIVDCNENYTFLGFLLNAVNDALYSILYPHQLGPRYFKFQQQYVTLQIQNNSRTISVPIVR